MTVAAREAPVTGERSQAARPSRRRGRSLFLALGGILISGLFWCSRAYPGMWSGMVNQMRYGTFQENWNLGQCNLYWLKFMQKLTFDPATGAYNFKHTSEQGMNLYERGLLAFHRGDFPQAISLLERHLKTKGESGTCTAPRRSVCTRDGWSASSIAVG